MGLFFFIVFGFVFVFKKLGVMDGSVVMPKLEGRDGWVPRACWPVSLDSLSSSKPESDPASIKRWSVSKQSPSGFYTYLNTLGLGTHINMHVHTKTNS